VVLDKFSHVSFLIEFPLNLSQINGSLLKEWLTRTGFESNGRFGLVDEEKDSGDEKRIKVVMGE